MKVIYSIIFLAVSLCSQSLLATEPNSCQDLQAFFPYKAGVQAQQDGHHAQAFDIFCNLSFKGDYRAQFKMAYYFDTGVKGYIDSDLVFALLWAKLSNHKIKSLKRKRFIEQLEASLTQEQMNKFRSVYYKFIAKMPTGNRIDMQYEPLDLQKLYKVYQEDRAPKTYTGSRIKRDKPPINLGSIQF